MKKIENLTEERSDTMAQDEALLTIIISPRHFVHAMDKMTRANGNGDLSKSP
jgi:hypothetical protein